MRNNPEGGELDPSDDDHKHSEKNSSVLFCIDKRTREGCDYGSKVETFHSRQDREGCNRRNLAEEKVVRKISSPRRIVSMPNL